MTRSPRDELLALINGAATFASHSPRWNTARWPPDANSGGLRIDVIIFRTDFKPSGFDRPVTGPFKNEIRSKLNEAGVTNLTLVFKRGPQGELVFHFDGPDEDIAKAKAALRIAQIDPQSNGRRD